jgi:2-dehydropantoate 2-reductase
MRILVYGAGNIGCLYAGLLANAGHDVSILARGPRLAEIREHGLVLEEFASERQTTARPATVERLEPDDAYDLVIVTLGREHVPEVLPILARNRGTPSILFMGNSAAGPESMVDALGADRVLLGFSGAAGVPNEHAIRYVIMSAGEQPTTIGELDASFTPRLREIAAALKGAGFPVAMCRDMDAWLKTHVAEIVPTACAFYMADGDPKRLARTRDAIVLMVRAIREGYRVLQISGTPILPRMHRIFGWLPEPLLVAFMRRRVASEAFAIKIGHGLAAREEVALLAADLAALAEAASIATPATKRLTRYLDPSVEPLADGSQELSPHWSVA